MDHVGQEIFYFLSQYGYWVMLPLMIVEGPVATILASMLSSLGAFNVFLVLFFSILGDIFGDVVLYWLGYFFGMRFVRRAGKYLGITESLVLKMEKYFQKHGGKTIFAVKSTTGLCWAAFVAAGVARMDFRRFLWYSFYGGVVWSSFLVIMGYFYGYLWREIRVNIKWIGWAITLLAIVSFLAIVLYKKYQTRKILPNDQ